MDKSKKIILISILPAIFTLPFILYIVVPTVQKLNDLNNELEQEKTAYNEAKTQLDTLANDTSLIKITQNLQKKLGDFDIKIPAEDDISILLIDLGKFAESLNIKILSLGSQTELEKGMVDPKKEESQSTTSTDTKADGSTLYAIPLSISAIGRYKDILNFINTLEKYERAIVINSLKVESYKDNKKIANPIVQVTISCEIYKFNSQISKQENTANNK